MFIKQVCLCKQVSDQGERSPAHILMLFQARCPANERSWGHVCIHTSPQHAPLLALLQSARLQNNGRMFRPFAIPQCLSDEGEPGIIQPSLISGRDPISIFEPCLLIRAAPDKCLVME